MELRICRNCNKEKEITDFTPYYDKHHTPHMRRSVCKKCTNRRQIDSIKNNPERLEKTKKYMKDYYAKNNHLGKIKSYRSEDRRKGRDSITLSEFRQLFYKSPVCFYCKEDDCRQLGLDRKDNTKGHEINNVVVCCEKCNHLLSDIPFEAKCLLKDGLIKIKNQNLLKTWTIKTKRKK